MPPTGKEVGRAATTGAAALMLGLLVIVLTRSPGPPAPASADERQSTLELLPPTPSEQPGATRTAVPTPTPSPTRVAATSTPTSGPAPVVVVLTPRTTSSRPLAPSPTRSAARPSSPAPVTTGATTSPTQTAPSPTPTGRITITSDLPTGCGRLGQPCRYSDAPAAARLGDGPRSVSVTRPEPGVVRVTAVAGAGGQPPSVGFVIRVCRCSDTAEDVLVEARVSLAPGSVLELQGVSDGVRVWVQELSEAGLSRGVAEEVAPPPVEEPAP